MNKARREYCQARVADGLTPKAAYDESKGAKHILNHAVWNADGALVKNKLNKKK